MKRKTILLTALVLSVTLLTLMSSDSTVNAQNQMRIVVDTGSVTLGPNQVLRLSAAAGFDPGPLDGKFVRFKRLEYTAGICSGGVCKQTIASQTTSNPIALAQDEAASFDIPASFAGGVFVGVRGVVLSSSRNVRVNAFIIDAVTNEIVACIPTGTVTF